MNWLHVFAFVIAVCAVSGYPEPQTGPLQQISPERFFRPLGAKLREARTRTVLKIMRSTQEVVKKLCSEKNGAVPDEVARLVAGDFENTANSTKCYVNCFVSGMGIMKDGMFQIQEMTEAVDTLMSPAMAERAKTAMQTCKDPEGDDSCEKAFNLAKCFKSADKEIADSLFYAPTSAGETETTMSERS